jgi:uncharacterized sulfatase
MRCCAILAALAACSLVLLRQPANAADRPNILWLTCEDIGPHMGCYGDPYANTPNLDALAAKGTRYLHAWSNAPVCAPARTTIISGMYPPSTGSQHMRSLTRLPDGMKMYPQFLREAGYYCTNNSKEDYNLAKPGEVWDESSGKAHWKNRRPGQPFFAVFNFTNTHESQIRARPHRFVHDPAKARVPAYHPDTPEVRLDWAQYYDNITDMDALAAAKLKELENAGLADDTIVFFYGDHGSGMPRCKRCPYDSGLHVPMIVYIPEKFRDLASKDYGRGAKSQRLVSFVDLAPTVLSLAGVKPPEYMQGHAFLGEHEAPPQPFLYGFRGRMDERYDMVRSVTDGRYVYLRNYMPQLPAGQHVNYMFITPTTQVWKRLFDEGKLTPEQSQFWQKRPPEELYDLTSDPDEVHNLARSPDHREVLERLRKAQQDHALAIRDLGFIPEPEIHRRAGEDAPYTMGHDEKRYPIARIMAVADRASMLEPDAVPELKAAMVDEDSAVRYWAALGMLMRGADAVAASRAELRKALADDAPTVRVAAAWALGQCGDKKDLDLALPVLLDLASCERNDPYVSLMALNAIDYLGAKAAGATDGIKALPKKSKSEGGRGGGYVARVLEKLLGEHKR